MESTPSFVVLHDVPDILRKGNLRRMFSSFGNILNISTSAYRAYETLHGATVHGYRLGLSQPKSIDDAVRVSAESSQPAKCEAVNPPSASCSTASAAADPSSRDSRPQSESIHQPVAGGLDPSGSPSSTNDCFPDLNLPRFKDALRACKVSSSPKFVQVLVSFMSKKGEAIVNSDLLRKIFSPLGKVVDVQFKRNDLDPLNNIQRGYGFVHFEMSWSGIFSALQASRVLHHSSVYGVMLDCQVCELLMKFLHALKVTLGVDLVASFAQQATLASKRKLIALIQQAAHHEPHSDGHHSKGVLIDGERPHQRGPSTTIDSSHKPFIDGMGSLYHPSGMQKLVDGVDGQQIHGQSQNHYEFSTGRPPGVLCRFDMCDSSVSPSPFGGQLDHRTGGNRYFAEDEPGLYDWRWMDVSHQVQTAYTTPKTEHHHHPFFSHADPPIHYNNGHFPPKLSPLPPPSHPPAGVCVNFTTQPDGLSSLPSAGPPAGGRHTMSAERPQFRGVPMQTFPPNWPQQRDPSFSR